jgi:hypothetical protein
VWSSARRDEKHQTKPASEKRHVFKCPEEGYLPLVHTISNPPDRQQRCPFHPTTPPSTPQQPTQPPLTSHSINDTHPLILYPHATLSPSTQPHIPKHYLRSNLTLPEYTPTLPDPPARIFRATSRSLRSCGNARSHESFVFVLMRHHSDRFGIRIDRNMRFGNG